MAIKSRRLWNFKKKQASLPEEVQELARQNFDLWKENPLHPSLHFKQLSNKMWSVRIGRGYRALGKPQADGTMVWVWIGSHEAYNKLIQR